MSKNGFSDNILDVDRVCKKFKQVIFQLVECWRYMCGCPREQQSILVCIIKIDYTVNCQVDIVIRFSAYKK